MEFVIKIDMEITSWPSLLRSGLLKLLTKEIGVCQSSEE